MAHRKSDHVSVAHRGAGGAGPIVSRAIVIMTCVVAVLAMIRGSKDSGATVESVPASHGTPAGSSESSPYTIASDLQTSDDTTLVSSEPHVGIVAGHWGHGDGATCPDGLTEVEVNLDVAELVVLSLRELGYQVDLLKEYDERLDGYLADALVSVHADSCQPFPHATPPPTGFKVASVVDSVVPDEEERLVDCLTEAYARRTGLPLHENSITGHMTGYHTFYAIDGRTPGAIIETGFMWLDRDLLTGRSDLVAQGIVDGVVCFVAGG